MITMKQYIGIALVVAGALLLIVSYIAGWTSYNLVLLTGLILIILGVVWHVKRIKSAIFPASLIACKPKSSPVTNTHLYLPLLYAETYK